MKKIALIIILASTILSCKNNSSLEVALEGTGWAYSNEFGDYNEFYFYNNMKYQVSESRGFLSPIYYSIINDSIFYYNRSQMTEPIFKASVSKLGENEIVIQAWNSDERILAKKIENQVDSNFLINYEEFFLQRLNLK